MEGFGTNICQPWKTSENELHRPAGSFYQQSAANCYYNSQNRTYQQHPMNVDLREELVDNTYQRQYFNDYCLPQSQSQTCLSEQFVQSHSVIHHLHPSQQFSQDGSKSAYVQDPHGFPHVSNIHQGHSARNVMNNLNVWGENLSQFNVGFPPYLGIYNCTHSTTTQSRPRVTSQINQSSCELMPTVPRWLKLPEPVPEPSRSPLKDINNTDTQPSSIFSPCKLPSNPLFPGKQSSNLFSPSKQPDVIHVQTLSSSEAFCSPNGNIAHHNSTSIQTPVNTEPDSQSIPIVDASTRATNSTVVEPGHLAPGEPWVPRPKDLRTRRVHQEPLDYSRSLNNRHYFTSPPSAAQQGERWNQSHFFCDKEAMLHQAPLESIQESLPVIMNVFSMSENCFIDQGYGTLTEGIINRGHVPLEKPRGPNTETEKHFTGRVEPSPAKKLTKKRKKTTNPQSIDDAIERVCAQSRVEYASKQVHTQSMGNIQQIITQSGICDVFENRIKDAIEQTFAQSKIEDAVKRARAQDKVKYATGQMCAQNIGVVIEPVCAKAIKGAIDPTCAQHVEVAAEEVSTQSRIETDHYVSSLKGTKLTLSRVFPSDQSQAYDKSSDCDEQVLLERRNSGHISENLSTTDEDYSSVEKIVKICSNTLPPVLEKFDITSDKNEKPKSVTHEMPLLEGTNPPVIQEDLQEQNDSSFQKGFLSSRSPPSIKCTQNEVEAPKKYMSQTVSIVSRNGDVHSEHRMVAPVIDSENENAVLDDTCKKAAAIGIAKTEKFTVSKNSTETAESISVAGSLFQARDTCENPHNTNEMIETHSGTVELIENNCDIVKVKEKENQAVEIMHTDSGTGEVEELDKAVPMLKSNKIVVGLLKTKIGIKDDKVCDNILDVCYEKTDGELDKAVPMSNSSKNIYGLLKTDMGFKDDKVCDNILDVCNEKTDGELDKAVPMSNSSKNIYGLLKTDIGFKDDKVCDNILDVCYKKTDRNSIVILNDSNNFDIMMDNSYIREEIVTQMKGNKHVPQRMNKSVKMIQEDSMNGREHNHWATSTCRKLDYEQSRDNTRENSCSPDILNHSVVELLKDETRTGDILEGQQEAFKKLQKEDIADGKRNEHLARDKQDVKKCEDQLHNDDISYVLDMDEENQATSVKEQKIIDEKMSNISERRQINEKQSLKAAFQKTSYATSNVEGPSAALFGILGSNEERNEIGQEAIHRSSATGDMSSQRKCTVTPTPISLPTNSFLDTNALEHIAEIRLDIDAVSVTDREADAKIVDCNTCNEDEDKLQKKREPKRTVKRKHPSSEQEEGHHIQVKKHKGKSGCLNSNSLLKSLLKTPHRINCEATGVAYKNDCGKLKCLPEKPFHGRLLSVVKFRNAKYFFLSELMEKIFSTVDSCCFQKALERDLKIAPISVPQGDLSTMNTESLVNITTDHCQLLAINDAERLHIYFYGIEMEKNGNKCCRNTFITSPKIGTKTIVGKLWRYIVLGEKVFIPQRDVECDYKGSLHLVTMIKDCLTEKDVRHFNSFTPLNPLWSDLQVGDSLLLESDVMLLMDVNSHYLVDSQGYWAPSICRLPDFADFATHAKAPVGKGRERVPPSGRCTKLRSLRVMRGGVIDIFGPTLRYLAHSDCKEFVLADLCAAFQKTVVLRELRCCRAKTRHCTPQEKLFLMKLTNDCDEKPTNADAILTLVVIPCVQEFMRKLTLIQV